jgi:competence protein ComEC
LLLAVLFFLLGLFHAETRSKLPIDPYHILNLIDKKQTVSIDGILVKCPSVIITSTGPETRLLMRAKALHQQPSGPKPQKKIITRTSGLVQLALKGTLPENLNPGDRFLAKTNVSRVSTFSTPGSFNYKKHLAYQSIFIKGWIPSPHNIIKIESPETQLLTSGLNSLLYLPERIRYNIANFLDKTLSQPARGLYKAILIGDRNDVPTSILENFIIAGCIHILAISGMHMGLLALVIITSLNWILKRSTWLLLHTPVLKIAAAISLLPLLFYALIAGFNTPVLRALLMTTIFMLAILFDRPENLVNHILVAALFILTWKPVAIFTVSFQLSFSAVIAIALIYPIIHRYLFQEVYITPTNSTKPASATKLTPYTIVYSIPEFFLKWLLAGFALTAAAMIGTFPLLLFHFNRISLVAPFTNILVEPLICFWALIIGLIASICIPFLPALAKALFITGSLGLILAERICSFFSSLPYAFLWFPTPSPVVITFSYLFLFCAVAALHMQDKRRRYLLIMSLFFLCSIPIVPAVTTIAKHSSDSATVTFLDVGHGSSTLLQLPGNTNILIDGGGAGSDRFNMGARVIGPFLWDQKISHLDAVVITHPHADHYNGLPFILKQFHPKELWINGDPGHDKGYKKLLDLASRLGIETKIAKADDLLFQSGLTRLLCLHSGSRPAELTDQLKHEKSFNSNDLSLVLRLETNNKTFLLPADISSEMAEKLVRDGKQLKADVLMAPHHGSSSSISQSFIGTVDPEFIAISAGRNNPFNFPAKSFYDLQQKGIEVLTTGKDGTITFTVEEGEIGVSRYQVN